VFLPSQAGVVLWFQIPIKVEALELALPLANVKGLIFFGKERHFFEPHDSI